MKIYTTYAEAKVGKHIPGETGFLCHDCQKEIPTPEGCGTGYAVHEWGQLICYDCSDKRQREEMRDRSRPFTAYVSSDGKDVTTWTGGKLGSVVSRRRCELTRQSFTHSRKEYSSFRVRDIHGAEWYGRGSPGICINLRPCK